jgi:hypothetical protein
MSLPGGVGGCTHPTKNANNRVASALFVRIDLIVSLSWSAIPPVKIAPARSVKPMRKRNGESALLEGVSLRFDNSLIRGIEYT